MEPKNTNPNNNPNPSNTEQFTASSSGTNANIKGKQKEVINVVEELDIIIKNSEQLNVDFISKGNKIVNQKGENKTLENKRDYEVSETNCLLFTLTRTRACGKMEKLVERVRRMSEQDAVREINSLFTAQEVKEIISELGISSKSNDAATLKKIKQIVMENNNAYKIELENKNTEIDNLKQLLRTANTRNTLLIEQSQKEKEQHETEKRKNDEKRRKEQQLLQSKEKAEYEQIKAKYDELEKNAQSTEEKLRLSDQKASELIALVYQKDEEHRMTIMDYEGLFQSYEIRGKDIEILRREKAALEVNIAGYKGEAALKDKQIKDLQDYQLKICVDRETAEKEANECKNRADIAEGVVRLREETINSQNQRIRALEAEVQAAQPGFLKRQWNSFTTQTAPGRWLADTWHGFNRLVWITGLIVVLFVFSFVWKYVLKPMVKNFRGDKKQPEPTNQNQPPIIVIPPQQPAPPITNYQPLPAQPPQISPIAELPPSEKRETLHLSSHQLLTELTSENTRTTSHETPKIKPEQDTEKNEQPHEETPAPTAKKKNGKKHRKSEKSRNSGKIKKN